VKTLEEIEAVIAKLDQQIPLLVEQRSMARGYRQAILEKSEEATKPELKVAESKKA
tara:strand:+ start:129 stop:296 length:168 start_codon:yes stop_codon:yes gene_type:complete